MLETEKQLAGRPAAVDDMSYKVEPHEPLSDSPSPMEKSEEKNLSGEVGDVARQEEKKGGLRDYFVSAVQTHSIS